MSDLFNTGIRPAVDAYLLKKSQEVRNYGNYWSASSAGYCMRKNIFERLGVPRIENESDARKQRVFEVGHIFHKWMQDITKDAGLSIAQEIELQDENLMVRGHFDDLILMKALIEADEGHNKAHAQDKLILYDYKTQNSRAFTYQKNSPISYFHKMQVGTYMYMLRNSFDVWLTAEVNKVLPIKMMKDVSEARILKISKDDLRMSEDQLMWTDELAKEVIDYWIELNRYWIDQKMPPCTCADQQGGFMAKPDYNPFYYQDEPCSLKYYEKCKKDGLLKEVTT